jgi:hypothetical protein
MLLVITLGNLNEGNLGADAWRKVGVVCGWGNPTFYDFGEFAESG